jgi:thymidylate synthase (FAD)
MIVKLLEYTPNPERLIAVAAKLCYSPVGIEELSENLTEDNIQKFLNMLMNIGHQSPLEHCSFTFAVEGVSRITEIQLVRHRIASYSIQSGRYVRRDNPDFSIPPAISKSKVALVRYNAIIKESIGAYNDLFLILMLLQMGWTDEAIENLSIDERISAVLELQENDKKLYSKYEKIAIEDARYAHLQSLSTKIMFTMNIRSLLNFLSHRLCSRSQWEIRQLANEMLKELDKVSPILFKYCGAPCQIGSCKEGKMSCGKPLPKRN